MDKSEEYYNAYCGKCSHSLETGHKCEFVRNNRKEKILKILGSFLRHPVLTPGDYFKCFEPEKASSTRPVTLGREEVSVGTLNPNTKSKDKSKFYYGGIGKEREE